MATANGRRRDGRSAKGTLVGYARCSTAGQDLTAQRRALRELGVPEKLIYLDHGLTGRHRDRPGLSKALAGEVEQRGARLQLGTAVHDPRDPMGKMFCNVLATFAEFEADLLSLRTRQGMLVAKAKGRLKGQATRALDQPAGAPDQAARNRGALDPPARRAVRRQPRDRIPRDPARRAGAARLSDADLTQTGTFARLAAARVRHP